MRVPPGKLVRCPRCRQVLAPGADHSAFPFCTERCRLIDLGAWMDEAHVLGDGPPAPEPVPRPTGEA